MKKIYSLVLAISFLLVAQFAKAYDLIVAQDGSGNYTTVQAAINAAPTNLTAPYYIFIKNGKYKEKISIPSNKPFLYLVGESVANTILYYTDGASTSNGTGGTLGTQGSGSFTINANDFTAQNITFQNTFGDGSQAVAVVINADRAAFKNCRFMANQDTLYTKGSGAPRAYFKNCYIDGNIDFIFGNSIALFDSCVIYAKTRTTNGSSYITAASTPPGQAYGYVFNNCTLPANTGGTQYYLGRPWQNSTGSSPLANNQVVYLNPTYGANLIIPAGWSTWDAGTDVTLIYDGEYQAKNMNGSLADVSGRTSWSHQLNSGDASLYTMANMFTTWNPCAINATFCNDSARDIAVSNFAGVRGASNSTFSWNISWAMTGITYTLYRSTDSISYSPVTNVTAANDTSVNFQLTDALPPAGSIYYYYVVASKAGTNSDTTDIVAISSAPTITVTGTLGSYAQALGTPSAAQTISVSAVNLVDDVIITPSADFEVSTDGTTWYNTITPLVLAHTGQTLSATNVLVRMNALTLGDHTGTVLLSTNGTGAKFVTLNVSGTVSNELNASHILQQWPLDVDSNDSAAVRYTGVQASAPTFNKLVLSDGVTVSGVTPYSAAFGMAFAPTATGSWASPGPGGTLGRTFYQQYTVTPTTGHALRIDSIIFNTDFYNSNSNSKTAVVYSLSGFTTDSTEITGATFVSPIVTNKTTSGTVDNYRFALNGALGINVPVGSAITFRIYHALGSSSTGRYGMIKNVIVTGDTASTTVPLKLISLIGTAKNNAVQLNWVSANEMNSEDFKIERSADGINYVEVGSVKANNSNSVNNYEFTDASSLQGVVYYRLRITDKDGQYMYSKIIRVQLDNAISSISIYPNPANAIVNLKFAALTKATTAKLTTVTGETVRTITIAQGATQKAININTLATGTYFISLNDGITIRTLRFVKQ
ncbi:pectinesterase family protein [Ferruginibacter albus]|uniref:pectinesterase family protein n=1 Tax=Ferruginibacter albus TaxID=2875540 RepID=UPI001CC34FD0|nr:pectinesterase family protein [Ferruginibacter albus]UAY50928.1 T9SS type A sorting domain-containing protein [Ferruginibacter albus]